MGIYDFTHGIRVPASSCATYSNTPQAYIASLSSGLVVYNPNGPLDVSGVCQLPVPEKVLVRQFVMVGHLVKGRIDAEIGAVGWNVPRQHTQFGATSLLPVTPYEIREARQKKVVANLPPGNLVVDRINCYFIQLRLTADAPTNLQEALEVFYFEIYWD